MLPTHTTTQAVPDEHGPDNWALAHQRKTSMKQSFIVNIAIKDREGRVVGQKQVIRYEGLLAQAHEDGLRSVHTELVQIPSKANGDVAIVRAVVITCRGTFEGIGDASPANVNARVAGALIRVSETRAKARALRDACNAGMLALEELDDVNELDAADVAERPVPARAAAPANSNATPPAPEPRDDLMTAAQRRLLFRLAAERGVAAPDIQQWLENHWGFKSLKTLGKHEASRLIERLTQNGHAGGTP